MHFTIEHHEEQSALNIRGLHNITLQHVPPSPPPLDVYCRASGENSIDVHVHISV